MCRRAIYNLSTAVLLALTSTMFIHTTVMAQSFPEKPIRLVVPFAPGAANDVIARFVSQRISVSLGQQVFVDNRGGSGGAIGAEFVAKSPADGYTLMLANPGPSVITPLLQPKARYDALRDFTPISLMAETPMVLIVHPAVPVSDLKGLIAYVKSRPGKVNFASSGVGAMTHLTMEYFKARTNLDMVHVSYKGGSLSLTAVVGGEVSLMFSALGGLKALLESKKVRALAIASPERTELMPGVPTISESGVPNFISMTWFGIVGPASTSRAVVDRLNREINLVMQSEEAREQFAKMGFMTRGTTPEEFEKYIKAEIELWGNLIKSQRIKAN